MDLTGDRLALQRLKEAAERAKCELSSVSETSLSLPFIAADPSGPKHINANLTREKFEELVKDLVDASVEPCQKALWDAKLQPSDIDKVILVDDNATFLAAVRRFLDLLPGIDVQAQAQDGMSALALLRANPVDLLLLDIDMPGMHGFDLARAVGIG